MGKIAFFSTFQNNVSRLINQLQVPFLCQIKANDPIYNIFKNILIIKIINVSKREKSAIDFSKLIIEKLLEN